MKEAANILYEFKKRWHIYAWLKVFGFAIAPLIIFWTLGFKLLVLALVFLVLFIIGVFILKPFRIRLHEVLKFIDTHFNDLEYSSALILKRDSELSNIGKLQREKIVQRFQQKSKSLQPPVSFKRLSVLLLCCLVTAFGLRYFGIKLQNMSEFEQNQIDNSVTFTSVGSVSSSIYTPAIANYTLEIRYPDYTRTGSLRSKKMDAEVLENSQLSWMVNFDQKIDSVFVEFQSNSYKMNGEGEQFKFSRKISESGVYNFRYFDTLGNEYISDLHSISVFEDKDPIIEIENLDQFTSFNYSEEKRLQFSAKISDDFGINDAYIIATVSKGSGESVKFREEKIKFQQEVNSGSKSLDLHQQIDLDHLKMEPGDELYFYVEALDLKQPKANISRSETYFAVIKDTVETDYMEAGGMGVDLLPDYFRSQRQLIIDTEKLIKEKSQISQKEFETRSNNLGFDQKSLRLKYGQFMGDETEGSMATENTENHDDEPDILAGYSHKHDSDNEHNLVEEHEHEGEEDGEEDPLEKYVHNHSDPEESTLFAKSLKSQLRQAINEMWDAELQLRVYKPKASLEYQYRALDLIQNIKNSSRIYVHRIGFDPPPLMEDKRLKGDLKGVESNRITKSIDEKSAFTGINEAIFIIEKMLKEVNAIDEKEQEIFKTAGEEIAELAMAKPGEFLQTLKGLKLLSSGKIDGLDLKTIQKGLLKALPELKIEIYPADTYHHELDQLMLEELEFYEY
ncbi:tryptophan-rich sensory protein [Zunongwangia sp. HRR-M8]|uniref:tryptophan-rich sensory protein n=1 Tax=Zunongwangia sp. HRR-M8 TaxID=3015170 RepID=UPI0022DCFA3A|nr:tryptophan-rich sensory protein [Zunongwangia sp. HRR-M8]WBL21097.1 tryptophan-rich sensory protein [Zunongwangia sp. HRR-M8]